MKQKIPLITIISLAIIAGIISLLFYFGNGQNILYGDARSHLNIARRVFDSTNPGLAQLGGVWLPLLHLLMLPTVTNDFFWHSGLSGVTVNFPAFILSVFFLFKIGELLFKNNRVVQILIPMLYILNPNILYMSTTAMTEILFIATFTGGIYFLLKWIDKSDIINLIFAGIFFFLTSVNRYEGWPIVVSAALTIVLVSIYLGKKRNKTEGNLVLFSSVAFLGIFLWLIWQVVIFGDPLYFLHSVYSSKLQTQAGFDAVRGVGELLYRNPILAPLGYLYAVIANTGIIVTIAGILGAIASFLTFPFIRKHTPKYHYLLIVFLLLTPYLFESYAIYNGNVPLNVPQITGGTFNIRLGMYMIPSVTILLLFFLKKLPYKSLVLICLLITQLFLFYPTFTVPITLKSASEGIEPKIEAAKWLKNNYKGGSVLASSATGDPLLFDSGLKLKEFITDGSASLFYETLRNPNENTRYIVLTNSEVDRKRDLVYKQFSQNNDLRYYYKTVFNNQAFEILELR